MAPETATEPTGVIQMSAVEKNLHEILLCSNTTDICFSFPHLLEPHVWGQPYSPETQLLAIWLSSELLLSLAISEGASWRATYCTHQNVSLWYGICYCRAMSWVYTYGGITLLFLPVEHHLTSFPTASSYYSRYPTSPPDCITSCRCSSSGKNRSLGFKLTLWISCVA